LTTLIKVTILIKLVCTCNKFPYFRLGMPF